MNPPLEKPTYDRARIEKYRRIQRRLREYARTSDVKSNGLKRKESGMGWLSNVVSAWRPSPAS
jgi:hypothetical protein